MMHPQAVDASALHWWSSDRPLWQGNSCVKIWKFDAAPGRRSYHVFCLFFNTSLFPPSGVWWLFNSEDVGSHRQALSVHGRCGTYNWLQAVQWVEIVLLITRFEPRGSVTTRWCRDAACVLEQMLLHFFFQALHSQRGIWASQQRRSTLTLWGLFVFWQVSSNNSYIDALSCSFIT